MELARYAIVFASIAFGGAILAFALTLIAMPVLRRLAGTDLGREIGATMNGAAIAAAVVGANWLCRYTGSDASYAMYALPLAGMVLNNRHRIAHMHTRPTIVGQRIDSNPELRSGMLRSERMNAIAELIGFAVGMLLLPTLRWL